jgi:ferrous iron transport protein B
MKMNIAVAGNPNAGKTTLFNAIAGTNYHVGNYAGVTVEKKEADIEFNGTTINMVDLPGTYSLTPYSLEEKVARDYIIDSKPELIVQVVDASNLERNLYLTVQILELGVPVIMALNMVDVAEQRGIFINEKELSRKLGIPVIKTVARKGDGKEDLLTAVTSQKTDVCAVNIENFTYGEQIDIALEDATRMIKDAQFLTKKHHPKWVALKYIESDPQILEMGLTDSSDLHQKLMETTKRLSNHFGTTRGTNPEGVITDQRYGIVSSLLKGVITRQQEGIDRVFISDMIDKVLTQRLVGPVILLAILYMSYQFTFWGSEYPVMWLESLFEWMSDGIDGAMADGLLKSLMIDGIIGGVGGVLGFAPLIAFMFFGIAILEDSGYMARIAYMLDRLFRAFGLQGSSVLPYIVSGGIAGGCAVPGVMASRTIKGEKERLLTILTSPFMVCGAKLPVFALLISAFFPGDKSLLLMLVTIASWMAALVIAKGLGSTIVKGSSSSFIMELPPYRFPTLKGLLLHSGERTWMYVKKAGTIILAVSVLLWVMMTFPQHTAEQTAPFDTIRDSIKSGYTTEIVNEVASEAETLSPAALALKKQLVEIDNKEGQAALKNSFAGRVGSFMEPVTKWAGFDWRTNIAIIGGIAAKEIVVSALGTAYSIGEVEVDSADEAGGGSLGARLAKDPAWDVGVALALIVFTILYSPCFVTVVMITKETGSVAWGAFTMVGYTVLAFLAAIVMNLLF